jgi:hypothetical protein
MANAREWMIAAWIQVVAIAMGQMILAPALAINLIALLMNAETTYRVVLLVVV